MAETDSIKWSAPASRRSWDVFLSFRGEDTRDNFTNGLYCELQQEGVRVFLDNDGINKGECLDPKLFEAIEDSAASIAIISSNYASSRWCLEELATICECSRLILPVFYGVDPAHVRRQTGPFEQGFRNHEGRFGEEMVDRWRNAMKNVGLKSGWVFNDGEGPQLIRLIVKRVLSELSNTPMVVAPYTVGLSSPLEELMQLMDVKCKGTRVLGLHGVGGIGKTTLSKALYNKLVGRFEHRSFISNVRETCAKQNGLVSLQNRLTGDLSAGRMAPVNDVNAGKRAIKHILYEKRVLIVLDDIDDLSQLTALIESRDWFYEGSRIIVSTRDQKVLSNRHFTNLHEVKELGLSDSIKLFSYHAFRRETPAPTFFHLSQQIVSLTGRLPLALEVFGSLLINRRSVEEWDDALQKLKQIRPNHLHDVLKISFNGLDDQEKCLFLDIACLFLNLNMKRDDVIDVMEGCGVRAKIAISVLVERSLIKISEDDDSLKMHDQIRDMGRQIVLDENLLDPGKRSRLWDHGEILDVLQGGTGTGSILGITLDLDETKDKSSSTIHRRTPNTATTSTGLKKLYKEYFQHGADEGGELVLRTKAFQPMVNLRLLQLRNVKLEGNFRHLPAKVKWLQWKNCPLKYLPSDCPREITVLDLSESKIERVWCNNKVAKKLMVLNLHGCYNLTAIPDLSGQTALEKLILEGCVRLGTIHKSVGDLSSLTHLNLRGCKSLVEFPSDVSGLKHLESLILSGCSRLKELPHEIGKINSLKELLIDDTGIEKLPDSIFRLTKLERLSLKRCESLKRLPDCIGMLDSLREFFLDSSALEEIPDSICLLRNLEKLSLMWCKSLTVIPDSIAKLKSLTKFWLYNSSVEELPASIGSLSYLQVLSVGHPQCISSFPVSIGSLASMVELSLDRTSVVDLPDEIGGLKSLKKLELRNCESLGSLPDTIGDLLSLNTLIIVNAAIVELPEPIGMLEDLIMLRLNKCKLLRKLPASFGKLKNLHHLIMEETAVTELPENFGMLSRLMILKMAKKTGQEVPKNPLFVELPSSFSNLSSLQEFDARRWKISGNIPDDFEKLSLLETLNLGHNDFCSLPSSLCGLSILRELLLTNCKELKVLPPLPSSLVKLNAANCTALESIFDLSNLESLEDLHLTNCDKLVDVPGLECLKSLRRLHTGGCNSCSSVVKGKLNKIALRNLYNFSVPGSDIPDWFTPEEVRFSKRKNHAIKAVIMAVVVSINHQIVDDIRDQIPATVDIQAKVLRSNKPVCTTVLELIGVPNTHEDQFYLCRYHEYRGLVLTLKDGDKIQVAMRDPPYVKGVELKKCGIHLVYEKDDDYGGDEELLDASQQSVSQTLTRFIGDL